MPLHQVRVDSPFRPNWATVKNAFRAENLNKMGVRYPEGGGVEN